MADKKPQKEPRPNEGYVNPGVLFTFVLFGSLVNLLIQSVLKKRESP